MKFNLNVLMAGIASIKTTKAIAKRIKPIAIAKARVKPKKVRSKNFSELDLLLMEVNESGEEVII